jgi:hypothetical protein
MKYVQLRWQDGGSWIGLDRIGTERFGEASRRSNGPLEKKDQKSVGERTIFLGTR